MADKAMPLVLRRFALSQTMNTVATSSVANTEVSGTTTFVPEGETVKATPYVSQSLSSLISHSTTGPVQDIQQFLYKPVQIETGTITQAMNPGDQVVANTMPGQYLDHAMISPKLVGYQGIRGDMVLKLQVSANPFQSGRLILFWWPHPTPIADPTYAFRTNNLCCITQLPHVELDIACQTEVELTIPYVAPTQFCDMVGGTRELGNYGLYIYAPLRSGVTDTVGYSLWAYYKQGTAQLFNPTYPADSMDPFPQSKLSAKEIEASKLSKGEPLSSIVGTFAKLSDEVAEGVPILRPIAGTVSWAADLIGKGLHSFGFSRPNDISTWHRTINTSSFANAVTTDGLDSSTTFGMIVGNKLQEYPDIAGNNFDEMSYDHVCTKSVFVSSATLTTSQVAGTAIGTYKMYPSSCVETISANLCRMTPVGFLGLLHRFWRGNFRLKFKFGKTKYHSGRLAVVFYPGSQSVAAPYTRMDYVHREIIDLQKGNEWTFEFPFTSQNTYLEDDEWYGTVYLYVLNQITAPDTCSTSIDLLTEWSMAPGAEFHVLNNTYLVPQVGAFPALPAKREKSSDPAKLPSPVKCKSLLRVSMTPKAPRDLDDFEPTPQSNVEPLNSSGSSCEAHPSISLNQTIMSHDQVDTAAACMGEKMVSLRQLIRRPVSFNSASNNTNVLYNPWIINDSGEGTNFHGDYLDMIHPLYRFNRGGMNCRVDSVTNARLRCAMVIDPTIGNRITESYTINVQSPYIPSASCNLEVNLPAWAPNPLRLISYVNTIDNEYLMTPTALAVDKRTTTSSLTFCRCPRDDYSLYGFVGVPPMFVNT